MHAILKNNILNNDVNSVKKFNLILSLGVLQNSFSSIKNLEEIFGYEISRADWQQR